jgi:hypothetical protein
MFGSRAAVAALVGLALASCTATASAAVGLAGDPYVVVLAQGVAPVDVAPVAADLVRRHGGTIESLYRDDGFCGFSARLPALAASGMRRDLRVASVEALAEPEPPVVEAPNEVQEVQEDAAPAPSGVETKAVARSLPLNERPPYSFGPPPRFRRVATPAADRYEIVLQSTLERAAAQALIDAYGGTPESIDGRRLTAQMSEAAARALSRDAHVAYVQEQSIEMPMDVGAGEPRRLPGASLRRVAQPVRDRYRVLLRASIRVDQVKATVDELMRAYQGRQWTASATNPRLVSVEIAETGARALSDDFRVDIVEEQAVAPPPLTAAIAR